MYGQQHIWIPTLSTESSDAKLTTQPNVSENSVSNTPEKHSTTSKGNVVCLDQKPLRYKHDVLLKLKATSTCEETKAKILSILEHLCGEDCNLEIYQRDNTDEIIVYGDSIDADPEGMAGKFNNDNITDKAEDSFQVDQENQGNTLLSVAPLPQQETVDKPIINGESQDSPPTNGHSAPQTQVADTPM
ncbi:hypothetical protein DNTS_015294 [Danionella cerebrum]|uniref:Uncharacterized protein n=1 Tax=Danionella cerebrum TaxID=2873325 RepID=A0A553QHE0_9TELE|nr:hypothetical protein DNTS_015294 [Danionella translucida]